MAGTLFPGVSIPPDEGLESPAGSGPVMTTALAAPAADLYARLDGLRAFLAAALAAERDEQLALEWAEAELAALCQAVPAWCPGCTGRDTGTVCCICGAPVPAALRRRLGGPARAPARACLAGRRIRKGPRASSEPRHTPGTERAHIARSS
jgi:hypothetical protein